VALLFLHLEFLRMLQFLRLGRDDRADVAIEVVMLRHEVSVLGRQVERSLGDTRCATGVGPPSEFGSF
jgi:hypothetical protein